jgi:hypothetical protein
MEKKVKELIKKKKQYWQETIAYIQPHLFEKRTSLTLYQYL